jgi:flagellum-specific peptidoglycan hydrolase FlgJ
MNRDEFLRAAIEAAQEVSRTSGLPAGVTVAQAILESNWGESRLAREAHNYFGIKAHGDHAWIELPTWEVLHGLPVRVRARFARYDSMAACFADRDRIVLRAACYAAARACAADPEAFARALAAYWATDPKYAEKLLAIHREFELDKINIHHGGTEKLNSHCRLRIEE